MMSPIPISSWYLIPASSSFGTLASANYTSDEDKEWTRCWTVQNHRPRWTLLDSSVYKRYSVGHAQDGLTISAQITLPSRRQTAPTSWAPAVADYTTAGWAAAAVPHLIQPTTKLNSIHWTTAEAIWSLLSVPIEGGKKTHWGKEKPRNSCDFNMTDIYLIYLHYFYFLFILFLASTSSVRISKGLM